MPGLSVTVAEQIEALRELAGDAAVALIRREHDPVDRPHRGRLAAGVRDGARGRARFPRRDHASAEILAVYVQDELGGDFRAGEPSR